MDFAAYTRAINWSARIYLVSGKWTFNDFYGKSWPVMFNTKWQAEYAADRHIAAVLNTIRYGDRSVCESGDLANPTNRGQNNA